MRRFSAFLALFCAVAAKAGPLPQASVSPTGTNIQSGATFRQNLADPSIFNRAPNAFDWVDYAVGDYWRSPDNWYQLQRAGSSSIIPIWTVQQVSGVLPGDVMTGAGAYSACRIVNSYTGPTAIITRASDSTTLSVTQTATGKPNISAIAAFISGTTGYWTTLYEQYGTGHNMTQTVLASAPKVDLATLQNGCPALVDDNYFRDYTASLSTAAVTSYATTTLTLTGGTPSWMAPGYGVSATNVPSGGTSVATAVSGQVITVTSAASFAVGEAVGWSTTGTNGFGAMPQGATISAISGNNVTVSGATPPALTNGGQTLTVVAKNLVTSFTSTTVTIQVAPTGTPGVITWQVPSVWMDIPTTVSVPYQGSGFSMAIRPGANDFNAPFLFLGQLASAPYSGQIGTSFAGYGLIKLPPNTLGYDALRPIIQPAGTLTSYTGVQQIPVGADVYGVTQNGTTNTWYAGGKTGHSSVSGTSAISLTGGSLGYSAQYTATTAAEDTEYYGLIIYSTAPTSTQMQQVRLAWYDLLGVQPQARINATFWGSSTTNARDAIATRATAFKVQQMLGSSVPMRVWNAGDSDTMENANTYYPYYVAPTYDANAPVNICVFHPGAGNSISAGDTGAQAWSALQTAISNLNTTGFKKIVLVGTASRGVFSSGQLAEFRNFKAMSAGMWQTLPGVVAYVDLEQDPIFGGDTPMTVLSTNSAANTVTVNALGSYATAGNYVEWSGMPYSTANDTGGVKITGVASLTLTLSGSALPAVGQTIMAIDPAPWSVYSSYWSSDQQHPSDLGYFVHASLEAQALIGSNVLP